VKGGEERAKGGPFSPRKSNPKNCVWRKGNVMGVPLETKELWESMLEPHFQKMKKYGKRYLGIPTNTLLTDSKTRPLRETRGFLFWRRGKKTTLQTNKRSG